jgi:hypothetical protein
MAPKGSSVVRAHSESTCDWINETSGTAFTVAYLIDARCGIAVISKPQHVPNQVALDLISPDYSKGIRGAGKYLCRFTPDGQFLEAIDLAGSRVNIEDLVGIKNTFTYEPTRR